MPGEPDHDYIEKRNQQKPNGMGKTEPVQLINDKNGENENGGGVIGKFPAHQPGNQKYFNNAVAEEVKRREKLRADGKIMRELNQVARHQVVRIFDDLLFRDRKNQIEKELLSYEVDENAADDFQNRENPLQNEADFKCATNVLFSKQLFHGKHT